jgi:DNA-directed RNA polymerase omega subunit
MLDTSKIYIEILSDGKQIPRLRKTRHSDSATIEGRTGEKIAGIIGSRYDAVIVAANRMRELNAGHATMLPKHVHGSATTAIQEIEQGHIGIEMMAKNFEKRRPRSDKS